MRLHCCDENMLKPAHPTPDRELILHERIIECFPAATVHAVMRKSLFAGHRNISTVI